MSSKQIALEIISKLPDEATLLEIARELEFVAGIREGAAELDRGEHVTADQLRERIPGWTRSSK